MSLAGVYCQDYQSSLEFIGVEYLAAVLRNAHYPVIIKEIPFTKEECFGQEMDELLLPVPQVVGLTAFLPDFEILEMAVREVRSRIPNTFIFLGGPFPTVFPEELFSNLPELDAIILGEGEYTTLELVDRLKSGESLSGLEGVWYKKDGIIDTNPRRTPIAQLDDLPFPERDFLKGKTHALISSSRGCLGSCTFCNERNLLNYGGKVWRGRSALRIVDEIEMITLKYGINDFVFTDSSFEDPGYIGLKRIGEIAQSITERDLHIYFTCYMRADSIKESELDLLNILHKAGMTSVFTGIEAGSASMLRLFGKRATVSDNEASIQLFKKTEIYHRIGFIMFTPETMLEDVEENIHFLIRNGFCYDLQKVKSVLGVYQTSPLYQRFRDKKLIDQSISYRKSTNYTFIDPRVELLLVLYNKLNDQTPYEALHLCESLLSKVYVHYPGSLGLQKFKKTINQVKLFLNTEYGKIVLDIINIVKQEELNYNLHQNLRIVMPKAKKVVEQMLLVNEKVKEMEQMLQEGQQQFIILNCSNQEFMNDLVHKQHQGVLQAIDRRKIK
ncbi:MAG: radical SAM protein [Anaerocolumna sp.]